MKNRREFIKKSVMAAGGIAAVRTPIYQINISDQKSANDRINIAVIGINGKGKEHYTRYSQIPNVRVTTLCDIDERLFPNAVAEVEKISGFKSKTEVDFRRVLEDKDVDAISIATPDHWHGLMTIWACQAGKDVYVEKPVSFTIDEGRKMVIATRKYNRIVAAGQNMRCEAGNRAAMKFLHEGKLGNVYMAKANHYRGRNSIGFKNDSKAPEGVNWDLFLGPAPERPFNENRFHYHWHYFWDYATGEIGNWVHLMDLARWGLNKHEHPVKVHSTGGMFVWDSDQETPNTQHAIFEYADGKILQYEIRNMYTIREPSNLFFSSTGWMSSDNGWSTYLGGTEGMSDPDYQPGFPRRVEKPGPVITKGDLSEFIKKEDEGKNDHQVHFENFINCMRSRRREDLYCDIIDGHRSAVLSHLANISYRTGRKLIFNPDNETFNDDYEANSYLTRNYRYPFVVPKEV